MWAYIVGIAMIVFGLFGLIGNVQDMFMPDIIDVQQDILDGISEAESGIDEAWEEALEDLESESDSLTSDSTNTEYELTEEEREKLQKVDEFFTESMPDMVNNMLHISEFAKTWIKRFAYIGLLISILYMLSGIFLMVIRRFSIPLAVTTLILSLVVSISKIFVFLSDADSGWIIKTTMFWEIFSILIDVAFLLVILLASRQAYQQVGAERVLDTSSGSDSAEF